MTMDFAGISNALVDEVLVIIFNLSCLIYMSVG